MARVLALTLRTLRLLEDERGLREKERRLREQSERQARDNARLLQSLDRRRRLLDQLSHVQRTIAEGAPLKEVLDTIVEGAAALLGDDVVALYLLDTHDASQLMLGAAHGAAQPPRTVAIGDGVAGRALAGGRLVAREANRSESDGGNPYAEIAVPVRERGRVVGCIAARAAVRSHRYGRAERVLLLAYAEHASLALTAAKTVDTMRHAFTDPLTGLANRALLLERLDHALERPQPRDERVTVLFLDLDRFKLVNDTLGHAAGDALLVAVAQRIGGVLRRGQTAARLGGDEFAVLLEEAHTEADAVRVAERIHDALKAPFATGDREVFVTTSIGIASGRSSAQDLLRDADVAMYRAKAAGEGSYRTFVPAMRAELVARVELEADIQRGLEREEFCVHYQPIIALADGSIVGVEALARWEHPQRGLVGPAEFIAVAEDTGMILRLGRLVLAEAARQVAFWQTEMPDEPPLKLSVNISGRQLAEPGLTRDVRQALAESRLAPGTLILELTETVLMHDTDASIARLRALKELDVQIAVDDFGTGYSSLRYLQHFPIDMLKIAKPFVEGLADRSGETIMARAITDLSRNLGLGTIAEGIEVEAQLAQLRQLGCALGQGYLFSRPLAPKAMTAHLLGWAGASDAAAVSGDPGAPVRSEIPTS